MCRLTLLSLATVMMLTVPGSLRAADDELAAVRSAFEGAVGALNSGSLDGFLDTVHEDALSFYSCGPTSGKQGREACALAWPAFPDRFGSLTHARAVSRDLFAWYNDAHHHSGLTYLTPAAVHYDRAATVLAVRHRTRLAAYAAHPERFVQGPPRPETLPTAVWINRPPKSTREDAPGATIVTPDDPQHGVIRRSQPISGDRSITLVTSVESLQ